MKRSCRKRKKNTCALPGQIVKYPYGPLVQRAVRSPARLLSLLFLFLLTLVSHSSHRAPGVPAVVRGSTSLLSVPAPFKYQGELRLGRRAPPSVGFTGAQSLVYYQRTNGNCVGTCQSIRRSNRVCAGRLAAIDGCYCGMVFVVRELWNSQHDQSE